MKLSFRITVEIPDEEHEHASAQRILVLLAAEFIRATARINGHPKADKALESVAAVLETITDREL